MLDVIQVLDVISCTKCFVQYPGLVEVAEFALQSREVVEQLWRHLRGFHAGVIAQETDRLCAVEEKNRGERGLEQQTT